MTRPIRIELAGALYHVTSRGDRREAIYEDDTDRERFLEVLGQVAEPGAWPWSSYLAMLGMEEAPAWLATDGLLAAFAKRRTNAIQRYMRFVAEGVGAEPIWKHLQGQVFLGSDDFIARCLKRAKTGDTVNIPKAQRRPPPPTLDVIARSHDRDSAMVAAHATGAYRYQQIAEHFGVHFTTVGRIVRAAKGRGI